MGFGIPRSVSISATALLLISTKLLLSEGFIAETTGDGRTLSSSRGMREATSGENFVLAGSTMEKEVRQAFDGWTAAWNRGDKESYCEAYLDSPSTRYVSGKDVYRGREDIVNHLLPTCARGRLSLTAFEVECLNEDRDALVFGQFSLVLENEGKEETHIGCFTVHVRKTQEFGWKIVSDHSS